MADTPEMYYRISVMIPFLDAMILQIIDRLLQHREILSAFQCLLPKDDLIFDKDLKQEATELLKKYERLINIGVEQGLGEIELWWRHTNNMEAYPEDAHDTDFVMEKRSQLCVLS